MKPIRSEHQQEIVQDPWNGICRPAGSHATFHTLSSTGCIESQSERRLVAADCGCLKEPAGFCAVCADGKTACVDCFGFCHKCRKPLCPRHSVFAADSEAGQQLRWCEDCYGANRRSTAVRRVFRLLLSPFFSFEKSHVQR